MNNKIEELFNNSSKEARLLNKPNDIDLLKLYGSYKQATIGDINIDKPLFYLYKETAKWNAWNKLKKTSQVQARVNYIKIVEELKSKYN